MSPELPDWLRYDLTRKLEKIQYWWRDWPVRRWINDNPKIVLGSTCASVALMLVVAVWVLWPEPTPPVVHQEKEWFYDLNTGVLFPVEKGPNPPVEAPSGPLPNGEPAGVRAHVFTYVPEPNEAERFIAFLETSDPHPDDSAGRPGPPVSLAERWGKGRLIRRPDDKEWVPANSSLGKTILKEAFTPNEKGQEPISCLPK